MCLFIVSVSGFGVILFSWYIPSSSPGQPFPLPGSYWMNIFLQCFFHLIFKNALIKISLLRTECGLNHQALALANKRKELTYNDFVGVCVIQKGITGNIPASTRGPLVLIFFPPFIFCLPFFFLNFFFFRIFVESSEKLWSVLFPKNTNLSDSCSLLSGDILCEMKIFFFSQQTSAGKSVPRTLRFWSSSRSMLMSVSIFQPRNTLFPHAKTYMEKITSRPCLGGGIIPGCPDSQREEQAKEGVCAMWIPTRSALHENWDPGKVGSRAPRLRTICFVFSQAGEVQGQLLFIKSTVLAWYR